LRFKEMAWSSCFSVKESVAERFIIDDRVFLAGDAAHIHSVNGGMGMNTGLGDAFNLIWKMHMVLKRGAPLELLRSYEAERKQVAREVIETSGELVRSTKYSREGTHATDYVDIVQRRSGYVTGMGVRYGKQGLVGSRLFDFEVEGQGEATRIYQLLDYSRFSLLVFDADEAEIEQPPYVKVIRIRSRSPYAGRRIMVRPDGYIASMEAVA
jgi:hypothetical protein